MNIDGKDFFIIPLINVPFNLFKLVLALNMMALTVRTLQSVLTILNVLREYALVIR